MESRLYHLHALTALHVGTGQGSGIVDLPIARERATHLPMVPGSALKGVLRAESRPERRSPDWLAWEALYGPERINDGDGSFAGALAVGDARLLCLPVRAFAGTFAWASCPLVLRRYARDLEAAGERGLPKVPLVGNERCLTSGVTRLAEGGRVYLEELDFAQGTTPEIDAWAQRIAAALFPDDADWQTLFRERFALLPDTAFDFLAETATELRTRVRIDEQRRTVAKGALWYEENLPAESVLWGVIGVDRSFHKDHAATAGALLEAVPCDARLQVGGKATVGRGQVRWLRAR